MYARANKVLELRPEEFWSLTPWECGVLVQGAAGREERAWDRAALIATCAMNPHLKKPITPDELLGRPKRVVPTDPAWKVMELEKHLERMAEIAYQRKQGAK